MGMEALAQLAGELAHAPVHTGDKDWNAMVFVRRRTEKRRHQAELEKLARVIQSRLILPAIPNRAHGENDIAHLVHRPLPFHAEAPLDVTLHLRAEAENEPPLRIAREIPGDGGQDRRAARKSHGDAGSQADPLAVLRSKHQRQKRFVRGFKRPDTVKAGIVGEARHGRHLTETVDE